ncbi:MAG: DUF1566 domain-containing protein [Bacteroidales bacterium]|nr:DUF1566 domain-containing protein [Bacteroidales bacterium]
MSYQAVVRDASDKLVTSTLVGMQISILQGSATGTVVYVETQTPTTNTNGLVTIKIGEGTTTDDFSSIDWANGTYFIKTETDPTGGTSYTITGTSQLLSVPYAMHAKTAEEVDDDDADPANELQILSLSNDTLYLSTGGYVYLGFYSDTQTLAVSDFSLSITNGNEVELPTLWERSEKNIRYDSGRVQIGTLNGEIQLELIDVFSSGGRNFVIGDDSYLTDIDVLNTLGIYGNNDSTLASLKLGADGPTITGKNGYLGISNITPTTKLDVNGVITATDGTSTNWNAAYNWGNHSIEGYLKTEVDGDATNELQTISRTGLTVTLTDGGTYQDSINTYTAGTGIDISSNVISISGHYVGELIGTNGEDGVVFWVDNTGEHGLICSKTDIDGGSGAAWSNITGIEIGTTAQSQFDGLANTTAITGQSGHTSSAAKLCEDYSTTGTSAGDWYLPSKDELSKIYHTKYEINKALNINSFVLPYYWSSTERSDGSAWGYDFGDGYSSENIKGNTLGVRAVRAF